MIAWVATLIGKGGDGAVCVKLSVVGSCCTTWLNAPDCTAKKFKSPLYFATIEWLPNARLAVKQVAAALPWEAPAVSVTAEHSVVLGVLVVSIKVTLPVGVVDTAEALSVVTTAVKVTG